MVALSADLIVSSSVVAITLLLSKIIRSTLAQVLQRGLVLNLLLEGVATFELCAVSFELGLVFENFGKSAFATGIFFVSLWRAYHWINVATSPYIHLESWIKGNFPAITLFLFVFVELLSGSLVYHYYVKPIWSLELSDAHLNKLHSTAQCRTLVQVHYFRGFLVEAAITFMCTMLIRLVFAINSISKLTPILKAFIITSFIMTGFNYTGGHMSPVLASVKQYGCTGITPFQHIFVYWNGPCTGGLLAYYLWSYLNSTTTVKIDPSKVKESKIKSN